MLGDKDKRKIYLVTNKLVINKDPQKRTNASRFTFFFNMENPDKSIIEKELSVNLTPPKDEMREHPDSNVDVLVFDVTDLLKTEPNLVAKAALTSYLLTKPLIEQLDIKISDEVIVIGYPQLFGLKHQDTNFPIVRQAIIASRIGENLEDLGIKGSGEKRILRGFLIDGAIIPGSSGSPVILKPSPGRYIKKSYTVDDFPPVLLGVVSEYRLGLIIEENSFFKAFANLGLVFYSECIKETIDLFQSLP